MSLKSNSFVAAAEQVCLQPVLEHQQRRGRRNISGVIAGLQKVYPHFLVMPHGLIHGCEEKLCAHFFAHGDPFSRWLILTRQRFRLVDSARTVCGRVCVTVQCPSVCPSVCPIYRPLHKRAAGLLLWARRTGDID